MKELPLFIKIFMVIVLGAMSVLLGATALQKKERGLDDSEIPREILSVQKMNNPHPSHEYTVLMNNRTVKKFIDVRSDKAVDEILRPDRIGWTTEFQLAQGKIGLGSRNPDDYYNEQKRAKAMFAEVLKLIIPKE